MFSQCDFSGHLNFGNSSGSCDGIFRNANQAKARFNIPCAFSACRVLPALVWHRQNWSVLFPYVDLTDVELRDLKSSTTYVAGFTNPSIENRLGFGLFIDRA